MATHAEPLPARHTARNVWVTVGVLAALVLAIGAGVLIGRAMVEETAPAPEPLGLATPATVQTLDATIAAVVEADEAALVALWAPEGVVTDQIAGIEVVGAEEIAGTYAQGDISNLERTSEVVQVGDFAAYAFTYSANAGPGSGIAVYEFNDDGLIVHQWVMGT